MNKNKIVSIMLVSTLLGELVPTVNASTIEINKITKEEVVEKEIIGDIYIDGVSEAEAIGNDSFNSVGSFNKEDNFMEDVTSNVLLESKNINNELNKSIVVNNGVAEITLGENEYVPDLQYNPDGYTGIKIITTGNKKLVEKDYNNLKRSRIPNVDLSEAKSDNIPKSAFNNANYLKSFKFPIGVKTIDEGAFIYCSSLTGDLVIPDSVTSIGNYAFSDCTKLTGKLVIPDSVTSIGYGAFSGCYRLTGDLIIPDSVTSIGGQAFKGCEALDGRLVISNSVTSISSGTFKGCKRLAGELIIPDSVTSIGNEAFQNCNGLTGELVIPDLVTVIGSQAFENTNFTGNLVIPDKVRVIGAYAFLNCRGVTGDLILPDSVVDIGWAAFKSCGFTGQLVIPNSVTSISGHAFDGCSGFKGELVIPESLTSIGESVFGGCSGFTGELAIPDSVTSIGSFAFSGCSGFTGDLVIPNSVTSIGESAFRDCSGLAGELVIPASVTSISSEAFSGCSGLTGELVIPESVTSIGNRAFSGCSGFTGELSIPNSVTSIGESAFRDCSGFTGDLVIPDSVSLISSEAFRGCRGFTGDLVIGNIVASIGASAFRDCSGFAGDLVIPDSVTSISDYAFRDCSGFASNLVIPNSVTTIGYEAFRNCGSFIGDVIIPDSVTSMGEFAFYGCDKVNKIILNVNKSFENNNYRKKIFDSLGEDKDKVIIEMPYDFDTSRTWLDGLDESQNGKPRVNAESITSNIDRNTSISLYIPTPYKEENILILKDGESFNLPQKTDNGKYVFDKKGVYSITLTTNLGTVSNMDFEIVDWVNEPTIDYSNGLVSIYDNGHNVYESIGVTKIENFDDIHNVKFTFSNNNWEIIDGVLKSETITHSQSTENSFKIDVTQSSKIKIGVKVSSERIYDKGYIYLNGKEIYKRSGDNSTYDIVEVDLTEGENIIKFKYEKNSSVSSYEDAMYVNLIEFSGYCPSLADIDRVEYRFNGGEWIEYLDSFKVPDKVVNDVDEIKVEAQVVVNDKISEIKECLLEIQKAQIEAKNIELIQLDKLNELDCVKATDIDGSDISDRITVVSDDVKTDIPGEYKVVYRVESVNGYFTEKEITVKVLPLVINKPTIKYENNIISITDNGNNSVNSVNKIEYKINSSEWTEYSSEFRIPEHFVNGIDSITIEARAVVEDKFSDVTTENVKVLKAEIIADDVDIVVGSNFNGLDYVKVKDVDGSDISDRVTIVTSDVKTDTPGEYTILYRVKASNGYFTEKEIKVTVLEEKLPLVINGNDIILKQNSKFNPLDFITVTDNKGNLLDKSKVEIVENTVNTSIPGVYLITYKITSDEGLITTKTINATVKEVSSNNDNNTNTNSNNDNDNTNNDNNNEDRIPSTGGYSPLICLASILSIVAGCSFARKRKRGIK